MTKLLEIHRPADVLERAECADLSAVEGLYVHVPFCYHKCHYCDFYSITRQTPERMADFVRRILAEADMWLQVGRPRPRTVFFGGGTPTLLAEPAMRQLLTGLQERFDLSGVEEWTVEANPATLEPATAAAMLELGVDRISMGAQSFEPELLKVLERDHDPADVPRSLQIARDAGFKRLNVDLIFAIPGQTIDVWQATLDKAVALNCEHLSCYGLTYEPNTAMTARKRLGVIQPTDEQLELSMLAETRGRLAGAGYEAYEISNYARDGACCRHNLVYWSQGGYIGLGPSAASHLKGVRWKNRPHLGDWERAVDQRALPSIDVEHLTPEQRAGELAYLRLRTREGIDDADFADRTGYDARALFADELERLDAAGLIERDAKGFRLTEKGIPVADGVAGYFVRH